MNNYCLKNMDTENIDNIELVRRFLSSLRDENFIKYKRDDKLKHQAISNVIGLLADKKWDIENEEH